MKLKAAPLFLLKNGKMKQNLSGATQRQSKAKTG